MSRLTAALALLTVSSIACAGDSTAPLPATPAPSLGVAALAPDGPNVWRWRGDFVIGIQDPETDLFAFAGLPDQPTQSIECGGAEPFAMADVHDAGVKQDVIHRLATANDINLDVFRRSTFAGFCGSTPIASGKGRAMYVDSDVFETGSGADAWGFRMEGRVTMVGGGEAGLMAHNRFQILPDGSFRRIFRMVRLSAQ